MFTQNTGWEGEGCPPPSLLQYQWPLKGMGPETHVHKITGLALKNPPKKTHPKKPKKTHLTKPTKNGFF
jgi:hypothetical protein